MPPKNGSQPATQADVQAVKSELKGDIKRLAVEVVNTQAELREMRAGLSTLASKDDMSRLMATIDRYHKTAEANNHGMTINGQALTEHAQTLAGHEKRLASLESRP